MDSGIVAIEERATAELRSLLEHADRVDGWLALPVPGDLVDHLHEQRRQNGERIARLLLSWVRAGGTITLESAAVPTGGPPVPAWDHQGTGAPVSEPIEESAGAGSRPEAVPEADTTGGASDASPEPTGRTKAAPTGEGSLTSVGEPLQQGDTSKTPEAPQPPVEAPLPWARPVTPVPPFARPLAAPPSSSKLTPPSPPAAGALARLVGHFGAGGNFAADQPSLTWQETLRAIVDELAGARSALDPIAVLTHLASSQSRWPLLPREAQVALVSSIASALRAHQTAAPDVRIDRTIPRLRLYVERESPGFVHGLARQHTPREGSWAAASEARWEELLGFLPQKPVAKAAARIPSGTAPSRVAASNSPAATGDSLDAHACAEIDPEAEDTRPEPVPTDWPWRVRMTGSRAIMVGGDPREPNRLRLEECFGFKELVWERTEHARNPLLHVRDRVRNGRVDVVFILARFVGHDADEIIQPACKERGVDFVPIAKGYGVAAFRLAIERYVQPIARPEGPDGGRGSGLR